MFKKRFIIILGLLLGSYGAKSIFDFGKDLPDTEIDNDAYKSV